MPRNGTGQFSLLNTVNPVVPNTVVATSWANPTLNDIASALTQSVSADGQTTMTRNLNVGGNKVINLASGITSSDATNVGQVFNSPAFNGTPTAPTAALGTNTAQIATTAFVLANASGVTQGYEPLTTFTTALPANQTFPLKTNQVLYCTANSANNVTINLIGDATTTLSNYMAAGNVITFAILFTNGVSPFFVSNWQVDGMAITPRYLNGAVITNGNPSGVDVYTGSVARNSSGAYSLFLSQQFFA